MREGALDLNGTHKTLFLSRFRNLWDPRKRGRLHLERVASHKLEYLGPHRNSVLVDAEKAIGYDIRAKVREWTFSHRCLGYPSLLFTNLGLSLTPMAIFISKRRERDHPMQTALGTGSTRPQRFA
jgi:uncharacterized protein YjiS (DUF1127 family)